jgi:hypothetical protein
MSMVVVVETTITQVLRPPHRTSGSQAATVQQTAQPTVQAVVVVHQRQVLTERVRSVVQVAQAFRPAHLRVAQKRQPLVAVVAVVATQAVAQQQTVAVQAQQQQVATAQQVLQIVVAAVAATTQQALRVLVAAGYSM